MGLLNMRDPNNSAGGQAPAHSYPITRWFAITVLAALLGLFILHHLVFSATVTGGVK